MGTDVLIVCQVPVKMTERALRRASVKLATAFGANQFSIYRDMRVGHIQHALSVADVSDAYPSIPKNGQLIECNLRQSYYGPDYERGDFALIMAVIEWLRVELPQPCTVYYGSDSGPPLVKVDAEFVRDMWKHFRSANGRSYYKRPNRTVGGVVRCAFCDITMSSYGGTDTEELFYCPGCGTHEGVNKNDGVTRRTIQKHSHFGGSLNTPVPKGEITAELLRLFAAMTLGEAEVTAASVHENGERGRSMIIETTSRWHLLSPEDQNAARERAITLMCDEAKKA